MARLPEDVDRILHDLRGPLNGIAMHTEVLKRAVRDDPIASDSARTIQQELERLADLLVAAGDVLSVEVGDVRHVNLGEIVRQALEDARLKDVNVAGGVWPDVVGDPALLARAVAHLVSNALEATQDAATGTPTPEVTSEMRDGAVALVVRDFGPGLPSTSAKVLIRLRHSKKPGHLGTGLVTVERIARLHGGSLAFESARPGARVALLLPAGTGASPPPSGATVHASGAAGHPGGASASSAAGASARPTAPSADPSAASSARGAACPTGASAPPAPASARR
jgi:signal transduction histidine kinase